MDTSRPFPAGGRVAAGGGFCSSTLGAGCSLVADGKADRRTRQFLGKNFDRTWRPSVVSSARVHHSHPARAEPLDDLVGYRNDFSWGEIHLSTGDGTGGFYRRRHRSPAVASRSA